MSALDRIRAEWTAAAMLSNDGDRQHALAEWARRYGDVLCDMAKAASWHRTSQPIDVAWRRLEDA